MDSLLNIGGWCVLHLSKIKRSLTEVDSFSFMNLFAQKSKIHPNLSKSNPKYKYEIETEPMKTKSLSIINNYSNYVC